MHIRGERRAGGGVVVDASICISVSCVKFLLASLIVRK